MASATAWRKLFLRSRYLVNGHRPPSMRDRLLALARTPEAKTYAPDVYGKGKLIEELEARVAKKFGKPAALYFPTGKMAQTTAHGIWAERSGRSAIALHPRSHFELHEGKAYREILGLKATLTDLSGVPTEASAKARKFSATHFEIPTRDFFYAVPTWDELRANIRRARKNSTYVHLDGARIWETLPYFKKSGREVAALFDSIYVSFYKGIGGISGSMLLGDAKFIAEAREWRLRLGGSTYTHFPELLAIRQGLRERAGRFGAYHRAAKELARFFTDLGFECRPAIPRSNGFCVILPKVDPTFRDRAYRMAKESRIYPNFRAEPYGDTGETYIEFEIGDDFLKIPAKTWQAALGELFSPNVPE